MTAKVLLERVSVRYGGSVAVHEVSESAEPGEWVGLIGPNGAGKSSLLRAIAHLVPHEGLVTVDSEPTARLSRRRRAQLIAYVPQQPELPAGMAVLEYAMLGRTPHIGYFGVESEADRAMCTDILERLDLASLADRALSTLSGGELQRVVLARALAQDAPVLLLDEPTSALDLGRRVDALELVDELRRERGLTVLSAMHDLTLAAQFADRLILLADGRIVAAGAPVEVLDEEVLGACFGGRVRVIVDDDGDLLVVPQRTRTRSGKVG
ncbi:MAG: cobalamin transport system ATP-binding protein [Pseudonocardiales bacterium]|nr:cobalamin transport system ATP-binding protein [Pseudonocardiales bacterium]